MANRLITTAMLDKIKLQHHGVKGMKWGVRRTPEQLGYRPTKSNEKTMDGITIDPVSLAISLGIIGVTTIASNVGNKKVTMQAEEPELQLKRLKDAKKIKPPEPYTASLKNTNNTKSINKNFKNNCPNTTLAYELRRRGYDVKAKPAPRGMTMSKIRDLYNIRDSDINITNMKNPLKTRENNKKLRSYFDSMPDGYRGAIGIAWDGVFDGGHIFNVEKINGKTMFIDSQTGKSGEFKGANIAVKAVGEVVGIASYGLIQNRNPADYLSRAGTVEVFRTDNAVINEANLNDRVLKG